MSAPVLNHLLILEEGQRVDDGAGGADLTWVERGRLWAEMRPGTGRERAAQELALSRVAWIITTRAAPPDSPARPRAHQRLREGSRIFHILAVAEADTRARWLRIHAEEEVVA
ncbi:head-tail adaptor protein [Phaeovulum vinaykumarii]|uniref:Head-tail adaptor n=1 Tax=Phaeovulum vinaykumarii TaxID=407234 RepID=A0A1N7JKE5_9RHOB|nr:head-tail adaptor protein [Phaeovulum vinaykumarii]SIS49789.1 head-tail adaptor [Phaeovulum vinaykumarii]SOB89913.1 head-tail adaptor [Phaeovulum vinaykumarii]